VIRDTPEIRGLQQLLASALVGYWSFDRRGAALADLILIAEDWMSNFKRSRGSPWFERSQ
jgi:hypothetical protein